MLCLKGTSRVIRECLFNIKSHSFEDKGSVTGSLQESTSQISKWRSLLAGVLWPEQIIPLIVVLSAIWQL